MSEVPLPPSDAGLLHAKPRSITLAAAVIAALGGLLFGFDTAVISGTTDALTARFELSENGLGFTVASALLGTIVGALVAGFPADRYGRKMTLWGIGVLYFVSALGSAAPWDWYSFLAFRFLGGLGVGAASVVCPLYIAEIAPAAWRGRLVALQQFNIVFGILLAYLSNYLISQAGLGDDAWRWMFGVEAVPALAFTALLVVNPESPRWLVAKHRLADAAAVLEKVGTDHADVETAVGEIEESLAAERRTAREPFFTAKYRRPILLAVAIAAFNQLSGINALIYYTKDIFAMAGYDNTSALLRSVVIGLTNLVFTMAALAVIDHFGRRKLMLVGSVGYIASLSVAAWCFYTQTGGMVLLLSLCVFIAAHAFGQGAVIWVFISEIFPNAVRARGQALGSSVHWVMAAAISWTFPLIAKASGGHTFAFYAVCMVGQLLWVLFVMPETKGVPLERLEKQLGVRPGSDSRQGHQA